MGRALLAIIVTTVLWSFNFTAAKWATVEINPPMIASLRVFATAALFAALLPRGHWRLAREGWRALLAMAVLGIAINQICFVAGMKLTTPSHSAVIHAMMPAYVILLAWPMCGEKPRAGAVAGMVAAVAGAVVVELGTPRAELAGTIAGDIVTTIGAVAFSFYIVLGRRLSPGLTSFQGVTFTFVLAVPFMIPPFVFGALHQDWGAVTGKGWGSLAYMIVFATIVCYVLHLYALSKLGAAQVSIFTDLQPALASAIAVLAGVDRITLPLVVGGLLALVGVALVQFSHAERRVESGARAC